MFAAEQVAGLMLQNGEQVDPVLLALVTRRGELGIVPRSLVHEPAPAGGVVVEPDSVMGYVGYAERGATEVGDLNLDVAQAGNLRAGGLPAGDRFGEQRLG